MLCVAAYSLHVSGFIRLQQCVEMPLLVFTVLCQHSLAARLRGNLWRAWPHFQEIAETHTSIVLIEHLISLFLTDTHSQLPVCDQQCRELTQLLSNCYYSYRAVNISADEGASLLIELLEFVEEINCSDPDSFQLYQLPVNKEECTNLYRKHFIGEILHYK